MEVRRPASQGNEPAQFFINVGASSKIRHDALTDILELLNARYKLAETVLFHRTKLALTGLLDRCIMEISSLYEKAGVTPERFKGIAETLLLSASDDGLPGILKKLAAGGDELAKKHLTLAITKERQEIEDAFQKTRSATAAASTSAPGLDFTEPAGRVTGGIEAQQQLALRLIDRLRDREVYSLAHKLRMSDLPGAHGPENPHLTKILATYKEPKSRLEFLRLMEGLVNLPPGSLIMNCPPDARMNAKVAEVKLFIEGRVSPFDKYEETQREASLTRGALWAQIYRFYELWAASVYVDRRIWDQYSEDERDFLRSLLAQFFFHMETGTDPKIIRMQAQPAIEKLSMRAAQKGSIDPGKRVPQGTFFPSGVPFDLE